LTNADPGSFAGSRWAMIVMARVNLPAAAENQ